jgi:transcription elongation factor Elf1
MVIKMNIYLILTLYFCCEFCGTMSLLSAINKWVQRKDNNFTECIICSVCYGIIISSVISKYILL